MELAKFRHNNFICVYVFLEITGICTDEMLTKAGIFFEVAWGIGGQASQERKGLTPSG